ncbi:MAG: DUF4258 domain-containing protein [Patescibacteria group bacterium]|mgnify:CR=1 FL=1
MKIILTDHTSERMVLRKITEKMIKEAITNPDSTGAGYQGRSLALKLFKAGVVKVVYTKEKDFYIIISVIWENKK